MSYGTATAVVRAGEWTGPTVGRIELDYEGRFLRRKRLICEDGASVMVDLAQTTSLEPGDALRAEAGYIEIMAAPEPLLQITGDLVRLAWHIGNRHTPCEVGQMHLLIRDDHVLAAMLAGLGAEVVRVTGPFRPEGGAYGHGRTHGHAHGPEDLADHAHGAGEHHGHDPDHGHSH